MENKTNKIIHYCWFGGNPLSELTKKCIETWKKFLPDFEIKEWNEKNFDVNQCVFVKEAYEQKKWAFVADYCRFKVLEEYGGMYLDTDMEITKDVSKYLEHELFLGCEDSKMINAAVVWAKDKNNKDISNIVKIYESMEKFNPTDDLYDMSVPRVLTSYFEKYGFDKELDKIQVLDNGNVYIYPMEYFYPLSYDYQHNKFTDNSCMIHHFDATWISKMELFKTKMKRKNMKWVVYVIDFFIAIKNKIRFFCNYRDISIFTVIFTILVLSMFSIIPINKSDNLVNGIEILKENTSLAILQILLVSMIWTFICAKVRNIFLNSYCDKITNVDPDRDEIRTKKLSVEDIINVNKREKIIFILQLFVTIILSFLPIFRMISAVPSANIIYGILISIVMYFIYLGIVKKFKYRILELVPLGIIFAVIEVFFTGIGASIATVCVFLLLSILFKNKIAKKRIIAFILSLIIGIVGCFGLKLLLNTNLYENSKNELKMNFVNFDRIDSYDKAINSDVITEFNAGKKLFVNILEKDIENRSISFIPIIFSYLSLFIIACTIFITKKIDYILMMAPLVLGMINFIGASITSYAFMFYFIFAMLFMIFVIQLIYRILDND